MYGKIFRAATGIQQVLDVLVLTGTAGPGNIPKSLTFTKLPPARAGLCPLLPSPLDVSFSLHVLSVPFSFLPPFRVNTAAACE